MLCSGFEHGAAGWLAQADPVCYDGRYVSLNPSEDCTFFGKIA